MTDKVLRQYAGNEMVDEGYHKAKDAWKFVKPYAEIVQEKGTELFHKAKESSEIVLEKGTELFYKAKEGEQSEFYCIFLNISQSHVVCVYVCRPDEIQLNKNAFFGDLCSTFIWR